MRALDHYILRLLADRWAPPARTPCLLDVSRGADGVAAELARVGFRVTRISLADSSLETVSERLAGLSRGFDAVVCRDVLELVDDPLEVLGRAARRVRPGGGFVYGVGERRRPLGRILPHWLAHRGRPVVPPGEMAMLLHRLGLSPREVIALDGGAYMGHSVMRADRPVPASGRGFMRLQDRFAEAPNPRGAGDLTW